MSEPDEVTEAARAIAEADGPAKRFKASSVPNAAIGPLGLLLSGVLGEESSAQDDLIRWIRGRDD